MENNEYLLLMNNISKEFPGVKALKDVNFNLKKGEVMGLLGENGAGKSTLIKILSGNYTLTSGEIYLEGEKVIFNRPADALARGIRVIYQEVTTLDRLTIVENMFAGEYLHRGKSKIIDWKGMYEEVKSILKKLGLNINPSTVVGDLTPAEKKIVEIGRAIHKKAKILIMDEPTSALNEKEIDTIFKIIMALKKEGISVIFISHKISEILMITDRVAVLRDGAMEGIVNTSDTNNDELIKMMIGRNLGEMYPKRDIKIGDTVLEVKNFSFKNIFRDISFQLKKGEILCLYGLLGSGRSQLVRAIYGAFPKENGTLKINEEKVDIRNPVDSIKYFMGMVPSDRKNEGAALLMDVKGNITLANINSLGNGAFLNSRIEKEKAKKWIDSLNIKTPSAETLLESLSGGNQQKVILARWLESGSKILILDEPTIGIDVGSKVEIYKLMEDLCEQGVSIIMISSELQEVLGISDRIIVMYEGNITGEFNKNEFNAEKLMKAASGIN